MVIRFVHRLFFLLLVFIAGFIPVTVNADAGVIVLMTSKCFIINTNSGYAIVNGFVSASEGERVFGNFNTIGPTKIFNSNGRDVSGFIFIEHWGLTKSRLQDKWDDKYRDKCN